MIKYLLYVCFTSVDSLGYLFVKKRRKNILKSELFPSHDNRFWWQKATMSGSSFKIIVFYVWSLVLYWQGYWTSNYCTLLIFFIVYVQCFIVYNLGALWVFTKFKKWFHRTHIRNTTLNWLLGHARHYSMRTNQSCRKVKALT